MHSIDAAYCAGTIGRIYAMHAMSYPSHVCVMCVCELGTQVRYDMIR